MNRLKTLFQKFYPFFDHAICVCALVLGFYLKWRFQDVMIFCLMIWLVLRPISVKSVIQYSFISIIIAALLMVIKRSEIAIDFASFSFYFLAFAIIVMIKNIISMKAKHEEK